MAVKWVVVLVYIRNCLSSNINSETDYSARGFRQFSVSSSCIGRGSYLNYTATPPCHMLTYSFTNNSITRHHLIWTTDSVCK